MYQNIGQKIKGLAVGTFVIISIAAIIGAIAMLVSTSDFDDYILPALAIMILGPLFAWLSSLVLYGFGELIEKATAIERNTRGDVSKSVTQSNIDNERIAKIEKLRAQGLITEEEYQKAISNVK